MSSLSEEFSKVNTFTVENIAGKLKSFDVQLHLLHWNTTSFSTHKALDEVKSAVNDFTDVVIEELMGYTGKRPTSIKVEVATNLDPKVVVKTIGKWAYELEKWAEDNNYCDIENKSQELNGACAKCLYLLTLS